MLFDLKDLIRKYNLKLNGIVQVGSHFFEEWSLWQELGIHHKIMFEADPENFKEGLRVNGRNDCVWLECLALGNENRMIEINVEQRNNGQSNTILEPAQCLTDYPDIVYTGKKTVEMIRLDDYTSRTGNNISPMNFLVIDVEGYELEVLKGATKTLSHIDYILLEVSMEERYKGQAMVDFDKERYPNSPDLDEWLSQYGFTRVETTWAGINWGDALYIKEKPVVTVQLPQIFKPKKAAKKHKIDKVFFINRESRKDRLENITKRIADVGLKASRFKAIEGQDEDPAKAAMIGCFNSHKAIWEKVKESKWDNVLILEDDAVFASNFNAVLDCALTELPEDYDLLYLGASPDNSQWRHNDNTFEVVRPADHQWCTHAYVVNKKVVDKLLKKASVMYAAIDQVLVDLQPYVQTYATDPYIVFQDDTKSDLR
jgi:glycosyl transferase family 25